MCLVASNRSEGQRPPTCFNACPSNVCMQYIEHARVLEHGTNQGAGNKPLEKPTAELKATQGKGRQWSHALYLELSHERKWGCHLRENILSGI